jgi:hypothetical protein
MEARKNDFKFAATVPTVVHGVTAPNAAAAPGDLSFGEYIGRPETLELYGTPSESDSSCLLLEFRGAFLGEATRKDLAQFVRENHSGKPRGFRYWDRLAASIWKNYQGLQRGKERTGKAHEGEIKRLATARRRAGKEINRCALRRTGKSASDKRTLDAAKDRQRAQWLLGRANKKAADAQALAQEADRLRAEAEALQAKVDSLVQEAGQQVTAH